MYSYDDQSLVGVLGVPFFEMWKRPDAIDACVCPKVDQDDFPSQVGHSERI